MFNRTALLSALMSLALVGAACGSSGPATPLQPDRPAAVTPDATGDPAAQREAACSGDVAPGCPSPQKPECKNGKWICVSPATAAGITPPVAPVKATATATVDMNNGGFSPATITVNAGTKVTFVNRGTKSIRPASDPHPTHTALAGFDPKRGIAPTENWSYTFTKRGTFTYHDHLSPLLTGTIIVK